MKFKYFLRGLGIGIIFSSVVFVVVFHSFGSEKISDKEVIERARELGMIKKEDSVKDLFVSATESSQNVISEQETFKEDDTATIEETSTEPISSIEKKKKDNDKKEKITTQSTTEKASTQSTAESITEKTTQEDVNNKTVTINIRGGMSSFPVCQMLEELKLIDDAAKFDDYLVKNGYANRISVGSHVLHIGMTYEEIAKTISDPQ